MSRLEIGARCLGDAEPTYFIADISSNHDGDLERAKSLVHLAAEAGADAAKFQNFRAPKIVSELGFQKLGQLSHQSKWRKSVYQVYVEASLPLEWTEILKDECDAAGIHYFTTPYDFEAVDIVNPYVPCYKIGSGDITWLEMLQYVAAKGKPVLLATGASTLEDVRRAVETIQAINPNVALMQCNTNYTGSFENFHHIHLNVLKTYRKVFPGILLGLSDHTPGHATVLGAVALGARVIEKHFTDDPAREGPDHGFSMTPIAWREMVARTRELELALGSPQKQIADNEQDTVVAQRRCLRAARTLLKGEVITRAALDVLRPAPSDGIFPYQLASILNMRASTEIPAGDHLRWALLEPAEPSGTAN